MTNAMTFGSNCSNHTIPHHLPEGCPETMLLTRQTEEAAAALAIAVGKQKVEALQKYKNAMRQLLLHLESTNCARCNA